MREANRRCYEAKREQYLARRRERRTVLGDELRQAERERYAARNGGKVRAYKRTERGKP